MKEHGGAREDLLIEDRGNDGETGHAEDRNEKNLALGRKPSLSDHRERHQDKAQVGGDIEAHLQD